MAGASANPHKRSMNTIHRILGVAVVAVGLATAGCAAAVAGGAAAGATYAYVRGWVERQYEVSMDKAFTAATSASKQLGLPITSSEKSLSSAEIKAKEADGTDVFIRFDRKAENLTNVSVRVGATGDRDSSRRIHDKIADNLGVPRAKDPEEKK